MLAGMLARVCVFAHDQQATFGSGLVNKSETQKRPAEKDWHAFVYHTVSWATEQAMLLRFHLLR